MVPGLVLAAGSSTRMGRDKALLPCGRAGRTFVATLIAALRDGGIDDVLVVGRPADGALRAEVEAHGARYVENPRPEDGQLSSLLAGLNVADRPGVRAVLFTPVDMPLIDGRIVATLLKAFTASTAEIVRPAYRGRHGHPVIVSRSVFSDLRRADAAEGARGVVRAHASRVMDVEIDDPAVVTDVDTPADYERLARRR
jgi:molybdenum cofactor cytidylyltransferase